MQVLDVIPVIRNWLSVHLVQVALLLRNCSGFRLMDFSLRVRLLHPFFCPAPYSLHAKKLIREIRSVLIRVCDVAEPISPTVGISEAIKLFDVLWIVLAVDLVES